MCLYSVSPVEERHDSIRAQVEFVASDWGDDTEGCDVQTEFTGLRETT